MGFQSILFYGHSLSWIMNDTRYLIPGFVQKLGTQNPLRKSFEFTILDHMDSSTGDEGLPSGGFQHHEEVAMASKRGGLEVWFGPANG